MTRKDYERAIRLADRLIDGLGSIDQRPDLADLLKTATSLRRMLTPPPTMQEILLRVPGDSHTARAREIGISRAGYYNLLAGTARRDLRTAKRLAELTGLSEAVIKEVW